jgi:hypothetical protein
VSPANAEPNDFFIGWLTMPAGYRRATILAAALATLVAAATAVVVAARQQSPGTGVWETDREATVTGTAIDAPYAMLRVPLEGAGGYRRVLVVQQGKRGAVERLRPYAGRLVTVRGNWLHRGDRWMLELAEGPDSIAGVESPEIEAGGERREVVIIGTGDFEGEIIDPKCYLGAMKPGGGKTHKGCAALCLRGGIPPMLATRDPAKVERFYLLVLDTGSDAREALVPYVGDRVSLRAAHEMWDDLPVLKIRLDSVRRR